MSTGHRPHMEVELTHASEEDTRTAYARLRSAIADIGTFVANFRGSADSRLLLAAAQGALEEQAPAVTDCVATYSNKERAVALARLLGARHLLIDSQEMDAPDDRANPHKRCRHCKREMCGGPAARAAREGASAVLHRTNRDDHADTRPGRPLAGQHALLRSGRRDAEVGH